MAGIVCIMSAILSLQLVLGGNLHDALTGIAWACTASCLAYLIFIRPKVTLFDEGITITNPFVEVTIGWQKVEDIEARYCMSILGDEHQIYAWAAPAPGRYHARSVHRSEVRGLKLSDGDLIRPGESPRTHSGVATYLAKVRLENFRKTAGAKGCESKVTFNTMGVVALILSLCVGLLLNAIHF
jgi:hypothetical protein